MTLRTTALLGLVCALGVMACTVESSDADDGSSSGGSSNSGGSSGSDGSGGSSAGSGGTSGDGSGGTSNGTGGNGTGGSGPSDPGAARRFFLPTPDPDNTSAPTVEVDSEGGVHAIYPAYAGGNAYYAYCGSNCAGTDDVQVVMLPTDGTVGNAMLALDAQGRPRVLLSTFQYVYWASCDQDCTNSESWEIAQLMDHEGDREVTGEALALDPQGRPRFLMHTYRALFGIGQKPAQTWLAQCDADCATPENWRYDVIQSDMWIDSHLRYDAQGRAHVATMVVPYPDAESRGPLGAYAVCDGDCVTEEAWKGIGFMKGYESQIEAITMYPEISLALTQDGAPRVLVLGIDDGGNKAITYFECDENCHEDNWRGTIVSNHEQIGEGLDLALDAQDRPRFVYTLNYNIGLAYCDAEVCAGPEAAWDLTPVELGSDLPPDDIFLWENCNVAAWFFHGPTLAFTAEGAPRIGYQARDISGGTSNPDPTKPDCVAGTDMTWSRMAVLPSHK